MRFVIRVRRIHGSQGAHRSIAGYWWLHPEPLAATRWSDSDPFSNGRTGGVVSLAIERRSAKEPKEKTREREASPRQSEGDRARKRQGQRNSVGHDGERERAAGFGLRCGDVWLMLRNFGFCWLAAGRPLRVDQIGKRLVNQPSPAFSPAPAKPPWSTTRWERCSGSVDVVGGYRYRYDFYA